MSEITIREVAGMLKQLGRERRATGRAVVKKSAPRLSATNELETAERFLMRARSQLLSIAAGNDEAGQEVLR